MYMDCDVGLCTDLALTSRILTFFWIIKILLKIIRVNRQFTKCIFTIAPFKGFINGGPKFFGIRVSLMKAKYDIRKNVSVYARPNFYLFHALCTRCFKRFKAFLIYWAFYQVLKLM
jgi:hypothetical protein